ncbi:MAG: TMEM43 family protein, partial [Lysobacterales bacterium]
GAYRVDATLAAAGVAPVAYPVRAAQLPANLAATFREQDGVLYAGANPQHPAAGDLRVSYRIVPAGPRHVSGVQTGDRLKNATMH